MKHTVVGARHQYETDVRQTADLLVRRLMDSKYWFDIQHSDGKYTITCGCDPTFINDKFRMNVEGFIKGNYRRKAS